MNLRWIFCRLVAVGWLVAAPAFGQEATASYVPTLTFDVASVRQSPEADSYMVRGSFAAHSSLLTVSNFDANAAVFWDAGSGPKGG